jgi:hypothetical protein
VFRACYQKELNRSPGLRGTFEMTIDIGADGMTTGATLSKGNGTSDAVRQCVRSNLMRLRFPPKGAVTRARVPFTFSSQ